MHSQISVIEADVLVLGGGLAGYRAAHAARRKGARVAIAYQARGASTHIIGFNVPDDAAGSRDSAQVYERDMIEGGYGLNDRRLVRALAANANAALRELREYDVPVALDDAGRVARRHLSGNTYPRSVFHPEGIGRLALRILSARAPDRGIQVYDAWKALCLLRTGAGVCGALLSRRDGSDLLAIHAESTILATGGIGAIYDDSTYPADITADSYYFALQCGASLIDMEFVQFEPTVVVEPAGCRGMEMPTAMFADGAKLINAYGERFMERYNPPHGELQVEKARIALAIQQEIDEGRGIDGTVRFDLADVSQSSIDSYVSHSKRLRQAGVEPARGPILVRPAAHSQMGGIRIDEYCATGVPGLYATGEASGGVHGASRIAGNGASDAIIFGGIAGAAACDGTGQRRAAAYDALAAALQRLEAVPQAASGPAPDAVKAAVRRIMLGSVGIVRNGADMAQALDALRELEIRVIAGMDIQRPADRIRALEAMSFVTVAQAIAQSALERRESRGAHYRVDYPAQDDAAWLCHVAVCMNEAQRLQVSRLPIA